MLHWPAFLPVPVMRVVCTQPARDPVVHAGGTLTIGSAADCDVVTVGGDPHHATLTADARGLTIAVMPGSPRVYVNARSVRVRALLRYGDTLTVGAQKFMVTTDVEPSPADAFAERTPAEAQAGLRIVSGVASGQVLAVSPELRLGAGSRHFGELAYGCKVTQQAGGLVFEADSVAPRVNGWHSKSALLGAGDQITLGEHRLVVEAPGHEHASHVAALPPQAVESPRPPARDEEGGTPVDVWWLIVAGIVLAAVIALLLYVA